MSSRLLSIAAALVFTVVSSAALACTGANAKSADGSQQRNASTVSTVKGS